MATKVKWLTDKYKSTTKIVPFVTMKSLTPEVKEYIESQAGTEVIANPTLAGTEADLTGLQVGDTKYKIPEGTEVIANPVLVGTEADLSSIQIEGTKYKVATGGGGSGVHLYQHNIQLRCSTGWIGSVITIITDSNASFTKASLTTWLSTKGFNSTTNLYGVSGSFSTSSANYSASGVYVTGNVLKFFGYTIPDFAEGSVNVNDVNDIIIDLGEVQVEVQPSPTYYEHHLTIRTIVSGTISYNIYLTITNKSNTQFTLSSLYTYLNTKGFSSENNAYECTGDNKNYDNVMALFVDSNKFYGVLHNSNGFPFPNEVFYEATPTVTDNVYAVE